MSDALNQLKHQTQYIIHTQQSVFHLITIWYISYKEIIKNVINIILCFVASEGWKLPQELSGAISEQLNLISKQYELFLKNKMN